MKRISTLLGPKLRQLLIVIAGIVAGQFFLYGPSLVGRKVLLPLNLLARPVVYLPASPETSRIRVSDDTYSDLVYYCEPARQFAISELRAGRLPMWMPYEYAGSPVVWPKFSPFMLLECATSSPIIIAWTQLVAAVVAGTGAYLFFRSALSVGFWAAAIAAWCFPITGFLVLMQGNPPCVPIFWLPWQLLMVDGVVRRKGALMAVGLSLTTGLILVGGALDIGGQVLLISGLYAVWCLLDRYRRDWLNPQARRAIIALTLGWTLGFALAAPYTLPLLEYSHTGARMERRQHGVEERPPEGLSALPPVVLPDIYGANQAGSYRFGDQVQVESSSSAYAGILATLLVAPLAFCSRRHRSGNVFWCLLIILGLGWCLDIFGVVQVLRLPVLNMMSHNRLVFAASFAILALAATGLDALFRAEVRPRWWFWVPACLLAAVSGWCVYRSIDLPEPIATQLGHTGAAPGSVQEFRTVGEIQTIQEWFTWRFVVSAALAASGVIAWVALWRRQTWPVWGVVSLGALLVGDLLWNANGRNAQCDPKLYYPRVRVLEDVAGSPPGRMLACNYLPAALAQTHRLSDIRGYDAIDPRRLMDLMALAASRNSPKRDYALTQYFLPRLAWTPPSQIRLSPVLDMLGVRYVIFRGNPPPGIHALFQDSGCWVLLNEAALPRVFVPRHVQAVADDKTCLQELASAKFDARETGYVEQVLKVPDSCLGQAGIVSETPTRIRVAVRMESAGLVVLSDLWDVGWNAYLDGRRVPILRVNYAVRGVVVPVGNATLEFRYEPASFRLGLYLAGSAATILLLASGVIVWRRRASAPSQTVG